MKSVAGTLRIYTDIKCMYRYTFTMMEIDSHRPPIKPQTEKAKTFDGQRLQQIFKGNKNHGFPG